MARQAREICLTLISGPVELTDARVRALRTDPDLAAEVRRRLDACGVALVAAKGFGRWAVVAAEDLRDNADSGLSEQQRAALAHLLIALGPTGGGGEPAPLSVLEFCRTFGTPRGLRRETVRSTVLGALERRDYIRVHTPEGRRSDATITAGARMSLLDRRALLRHLESEVLSGETH